MKTALVNPQTIPEFESCRAVQVAEMDAEFISHTKTVPIIFLCGSSTIGNHQAKQLNVLFNQLRDFCDSTWLVINCLVSWTYDAQNNVADA